MNKQFKLNMRDYIHQPAGKLFFNREMFGYLAPKYDLINRMLSFNRDAVWKKQLINKLPDIKSPCCLDIACGTGDLTFLLAAKYPESNIIGLDLTEEMLTLARSRVTPALRSLGEGGSHDLSSVALAKEESRVTFIPSNMCDLKFQDNTFDIITAGYALRNSPDLEKALTEIKRVMKSGATCAIIDFSKSPNHFIQNFQDILLRLWCGMWGFLIHRNPQLYTYIAASLRQFPDRVTLKQLISSFGFINIRCRKHFFGFAESLFFQKL